jgi:hypothetical protein
MRSIAFPRPALPCRRLPEAAGLFLPYHSFTAEARRRKEDYIISGYLLLFFENHSRLL